MDNNKKYKDESFSKALWSRIKTTASHFNQWTARKPGDSLITKLSKGIAKIFGIIISIFLSPLVLLALFLAFIAAL